MKSQCQMIRDYLEAGHSLSPIDALNMFGCFRLASRISDLKKQGLDIDKRIVENADNGKRWAEYYLKKGSAFLEPPAAANKAPGRSPDQVDALAQVAAAEALLAPLKIGPTARAELSRTGRDGVQLELFEEAR